MADRIRTVRSSGGNYSTLEGCLDGEAGDLTATSERLWVQCGAFEDSTPVNQSSGWTTSSEYYVYITADDNHAGVWSASVYRLIVTTNYAAFLTSGIPHLRTEGLQIANARSSTSSNYAQIYGNTDHWHHRGLFVGYNPSTGAAYAHYSTGQTFLTTATILISVGGAGSSSYCCYPNPASGYAHTFRNVTMYGGRASMRAFNTGAGDIYWYNVHASNFGEDTVNESDGTLTSGSDYNLTEQATAPTNFGGNSVTSATAAFEDETWTTYPWEMDLRRTLSDDGVDVGVSQSSYFTDDVVGVPWSVWDIGANETASGSTDSEVYDAASVRVEHAYQIAYPASEVSSSGWTASSGTRYEAIDDPLGTDDGEYISTPDT